jgi:hypothetical protein
LRPERLVERGVDDAFVGLGRATELATGVGISMSAAARALVPDLGQDVDAPSPKPARNWR